jgi:RNA polymerase sigma-70 factor (ECF subfamily)
MDRGEIEELYSKYGPAVLRRARTLLRNEEAARDAVQEVFVKALSNRRRFRSEASPTTWLYRLTINHCLNFIRDRRTRSRLLETYGARSAETPARTEGELAVLELLERVPENLRAVAVCYFVEQMNQAEIAELVGTSRRTVGNRIEAFRELASELLEGP